MIVPVMAILNLVLTQQIYSEETNGAHAHYREAVPLSVFYLRKKYKFPCKRLQIGQRLWKLCLKMRTVNFKRYTLRPWKGK